MKKLCLITHVCRKNDGQGRVNYEIVKSALNAGWHVTFLGTEIADDISGHPALKWIRIPASKLPSNLIKYQVFAWKTSRWLKANRHLFDVIQANGFITWHKADVNTAHFVHAGWRNSGYYPHRWFASLRDAYHCLFTSLNSVWEKRAFNQARSVIAVSGKIRDELLQIEVPLIKITVVVNGVDLEEFQPGPASRGFFNLPQNVPLALFAGDIRTARKNLETVLRSISNTREWHLAVAGNVEGSPYLALAKQLGIMDRVHFLGMVADMPNLMRSVDMFAFPSRYEAMSLVLLEAMASGLAVITAASAGGAEIVGGGGFILKDPNDVKQLVAYLDLFLSDPKRLVDMGTAARAIALNYSWTAMSQKYLEIYESIARTKNIKS